MLQGRHGRFLASNDATVQCHAAATAAVFYFSKPSQRPSLVSSGGAVFRVYPKIVNCTVPSQVDQWDSGANLRDQSA